MIRKLGLRAQAVNHERRSVGRAITDNDNCFEELMKKTDAAWKNYDARNLRRRFVAEFWHVYRLTVWSLRCEHDWNDSRHINAGCAYRRSADHWTRICDTNWRKRDRDRDLLRSGGCRDAECKVESAI